MTTDKKTPPMKPSEEATRTGLVLARAQGAAYGTALKHMTAIVADDGGEKQGGEYLVGYAVEKAEGMYMWHDGALDWTEPTSENVHLEVAVRDAADGRFLPGIKVTAALFGDNDWTSGPVELPFLWHPALYHYGRNLKVPASGAYRLVVEIAPPEFPRHDKVNGLRYREGAKVEFEKVEIETGKG
jgi:hypothetical protein